MIQTHHLQKFPIFNKLIKNHFQAHLIKDCE